MLSKTHTYIFYAATYITLDVDCQPKLKKIVHFSGAIAIVHLRLRANPLNTRFYDKVRSVIFCWCTGYHNYPKKHFLKKRPPLRNYIHNYICSNLNLDHIMLPVCEVLMTQHSYKSVRELSKKWSGIVVTFLWRIVMLHVVFIRLRSWEWMTMYTE